MRMALESRSMTLDELGQYLRDISNNKINSSILINPSNNLTTFLVQ
jgi:hypothetical protein